ncbi:hypothetical protein DFS34DRAFT_650740 [Phlyctochytrium arcticum]|nr:hypothetical protein DFS34DRAFT_650740 [Phlyctochytrium arcticum]
MVLVLELRTLSIEEEGRQRSAQVNLPPHRTAYLPVLVKERPLKNLSHTSYVQKQSLFTPENSAHHHLLPATIVASDRNTMNHSH